MPDISLISFLKMGLTKFLFSIRIIPKLRKEAKKDDNFVQIRELIEVKHAYFIQGDKDDCSKMQNF